MWGKCVKQTAGILRWMDRVHLLGHSEVGRVGKNTNPKKLREDTNICGGWSIQRAKRRRRKGKAELDFAKAFFPLFEGACYRGGRRKCLRPCSTAFAFTWNARRLLETEHIAHCTLFIAHRALHNAHCVGAAFEWPETGLLARLWDVVVHLPRTLQPLYLSTRSTLLQPFRRQGAAVRRMHLALPRLETSGFGSGLDSAWTDCVWSGLVKMDCCTNCSLV